MNKVLVDPKTIKFALKFLVKTFIAVIVVGAVILTLIKLDVFGSISDVSAGIFKYDRTYGELAHTGVDLYVADEEETRVRGLGGFSSIRENQGMLFVFDDIGKHGFWMKDMNFPIDIMWMDEYYKIIYIEENVKPESYPKIYGANVDSKYVLEVNAGFVEENDVVRGDILQVL